MRRRAPVVITLAVVLLESCAQPRPVGPEHSPAWKACKARCVDGGATRAAVVELDEGRACFCAGETT